jgi:aspartyl-tRNA(Asn)/glutamyl-tRNA(Gln) amidotransferase subunit C
MEINDAVIDHIAHLARLEFNGVEKENIKKDLTNIIGFIDQLNEVNVDGVEPLIYMTDSINVLRADEYKPEITQAEALKNAPLHDSDYFKIAKVLKN